MTSPVSNDSTRREGRPRPPFPAARIAAAVIATAALAPLAAGCGGSAGTHVAQLGSTTTQSGSSPATTAASTQATAALAFARCMRSNGVLSFPDPDNPQGGFDKSAASAARADVGSSRFQAASSRCNHLLPNGGSRPSPALVQQVRAEALEFARCVRAHGVRNFPDPGNDGRIPDPATAGINQGSPRFEAANQACGRYRPPYMPSNAAYNAYARSLG